MAEELNISVLPASATAAVERCRVILNATFDPLRRLIAEVDSAYALTHPGDDMVVGISLEDLPGHYPPSMLVGTIYGIALLRLRSLMRSQWIAELGLSLRPPATLETQAVDFAYPTRPPVDLRRSLTVLAAPLHRHAPPARLLNPLIRGEAVAA